MSPLDWIRAHPLRVLLGGAALAGMAAGALVPVPEAGAEADPQIEWSLPGTAVLARTDDAEFAAVRSAAVWGGEAPGSAAGGVKAPSWKLTGIIARPLPTALIVAAGARQVMPVRAGGSLPDGGVVASLSSGSLIYTRDGCRFERALYAAAETLLEGTCAVPAATTAPPPKPVSSP